MKADTSTVQRIGGWLNDLAKITRHKQGKMTPEDKAEWKNELALYATMLSKDFPIGAFTLDSLHATAQGNAFFPAYEEIRARVQEWWNQHRPASATPMVGGPEVHGLSVMDRSWLDFYHRRRGELLEKLGDRPIPDLHRDGLAYHGTDLGRLDSLIRSQSPAAWARIRGRTEDREPRDLGAERQRVTELLDREMPFRSTRQEAVPKAEQRQPQPSAMSPSQWDAESFDVMP